MSRPRSKWSIRHDEPDGHEQQPDRFDHLARLELSFGRHHVRHEADNR
jgi:hypothetical protein